MTLSCIYFVLRYENTRQTKYVYIAALLFGLAFVAHQTAMLLAPPILLLMLSRGKGQLILRPGRLALALLISALPLLLFLYLMVRAKANPPSNWGDPNDLHRLWIHFTRQQYPSELTKNARSWMLFAGQMRLLARDVFTEFSPFLLAFIPIGILGMWKAGGWRKAIFFFAIALIPTVGFMLILSPPLEREIINSVRVFHLYAWAATALFIAAAIDHIGAQDPVSNLRSWARGAFLWTLALSLSLVVCLSNYSAVNMRGNYLAYDYARNTLASLAPDAIIFPGGDTNTFPMLYCTIVEGLRPDVAIADKYGYIEKSMYRDMPGKPPEVENREMRLAITKWIVEHTKRPVYFDTPPNLPGVRIKPEGLVFRIADGAAGRQREVWDAYKWHNIDGDKFPLKTEDYDSQTIMADYCTMRAHYYLGKGMRYEARDMIKRAAGYGWGVKELLNNLGGMAAENNFLELAETLLQQAVEIDSAYATPRRNLEMLHNQMRRSMEETTQPDRFIPRPSLPPQLPQAPLRRGRIGPYNGSN